MTNITKQTCFTLAYYNFAGRNRKEPADPSLLADAVEGIMMDPQRYRTLASSVREYVIDRYDYRAGAVKLEKLYEGALKSPPLTLMERVNLGVTRWILGYGRRFYKGCKIDQRNRLRMGPQVSEHGIDS